MQLSLIEETEWKPRQILDGIPNPVALEFEKLAKQVYAQGHKRYSARAILHRIRWFYQIDKGQREFKCNNNWSATLARWAMRNNPELAGFFETRRSQ